MRGEGWGRNTEPVILGEAMNPRSCGFNELQRSILRFTQDRLRLLRMTASRVFPRPANSCSFPNLPRQAL